MAKHNPTTVSISETFVKEIPLPVKNHEPGCSLKRWQSSSNFKQNLSMEVQSSRDIPLECP